MKTLIKIAVVAMLLVGNVYAESTPEQIAATAKLKVQAKQGDADAQFNLGVAYFDGEGVEQDQREAVSWFRKAAEQGDADAQFRLGVAYAIGKGVIEDYVEAYIWHSIAKVNGNEPAAENLRNIKWDEHLTRSEIKAAKVEAKRRLAAIDKVVANQ